MFLLGSEKQDERFLGDTEAVRLIEETLQEEKETDKKLTKPAKKKNVEANELGEGDESGIAGKKSKTARA